MAQQARKKTMADQVVEGTRKAADDNHNKKHRENARGNAPSTPAQGDTRKFWQGWSISPDGSGGFNIKTPKATKEDKHWKKV